MSDFFETILRSKDLAYFQLEFVNFIRDTEARPVPLLKRASPAPAFIVMHLPSQHMAETAARADADHPSFPYPASLSCPSCIAFEIPAGISQLPFKLDTILELLTRLPVVSTETFSATGPATIIEFPDRLLLVPQPSSRLTHESAPPPLADWTPIWHTRLRSGSAGRGLRLRAVRNATDADRFPPGSFTTLDKRKRGEIAAHCQRTPDAGIIASDFLLTALGATAQLRSDWPASASSTLQSWQQDSVIGRDQHVETVETGYLFPFGHRASLTTVTDREISGGIAGLVQRQFLTIQETERRYDGAVQSAYAHAGREMPFRSVRLAAARDLPIGPAHTVPLPVAAVDRSGNEVSFGVTMVFITLAEARDSQKLAGLSAQFEQAAVEIMGQKVALADNDLAGGDTEAAVGKLQFGVQILAVAGPVQPPFLPRMLSAVVSVPAIEHLLGAAPGGVSSPTPGTVKMVFHPHYLANGFSAANPKQIYARFEDALPGLSVPAERAGGLAAPRFPPIDGLSRTSGPIAGVQKAIEDAPIIPADLIGSTTLLGSIPLALLIDTVRPSGDGQQIGNFAELFNNLENLPSSLTQPLLTTIRSGAEVETRFLWKPKIRSGNLPPVIQNGSDGALGLVMKGRIRKSSDPAKAVEIEGVLKNFKLDFGSLLMLDFSRLAFKSGIGRQMQLDLSIKAFTFGETLKFVKPVLDLLSVGGRGNGLSIEPRPDGVVARFGVGIPSFGLGAMNLENIALSSSISLPFVEGKPASVRVALSERSRPFLVSVSLLGGTGFFAVEVRTDRSARVEGAIEFGGIIAINLLGIVKGGIYAFAGIYVSVESDEQTTKVLINGFVRWGGYADVLGLISASIEFFVALDYDFDTKILSAEAALTIGVKVLFFGESFTFRIRQQVADFGALPTDIITMALEQNLAGEQAASPAGEAQWEKYCRAFA